MIEYNLRDIAEAVSSAQDIVAGLRQNKSAILMQERLTQIGNILMSCLVLAGDLQPNSPTEDWIVWDKTQTAIEQEELALTLEQRCECPKEALAWCADRAAQLYALYKDSPKYVDARAYEYMPFAEQAIFEWRKAHGE